MSDDVRRSLQKIQAPDEIEAQRRAWALVRASFDAREPVSWQRRNRRPLLVVALALLVLLAAFVSPPGRALVGSVRDAVTPDENTPKPKPALTALPAGWIAPGQLEQGPVDRPSRRVDAAARPLVGRRAGRRTPSTSRSRARIGLAALTPDGTTRWSLARSKLLHGARWSLEPPSECCRIAYLNGRQLRVVAGDGDRRRSAAERRRCRSPPAWRPGVTRQVAFSTIDGRIELVDVDTTKTIWLSAPGDPPIQLVWSDDGQRLLALGERSLRVFDSDGNKLWAIGMPVGPSGSRLRPQEPPVHPDPLLARRPSEATSCSSRPRRPPASRGSSTRRRATSGRSRSRRTASGCSSAGSTRTSGCSCGSRRPRSSRCRTSSSSSAAPSSAPLEKAFPSSVRWCCPSLALASLAHVGTPGSPVDPSLRALA